jgi:hypothetical protein
MARNYRDNKHQDVWPMMTEAEEIMNARDIMQPSEEERPTHIRRCNPINPSSLFQHNYF